MLKAMLTIRYGKTELRGYFMLPDSMKMPMYIPLENQSTFELQSIPLKIDGKRIKKEAFTDDDKYVYEARNNTEALHFRA